MNDTEEKGDMQSFGDLLAYYDMTFEALISTKIFDNWELHALEKGDYGRLRLSSGEKIAQAICRPEDNPEETVVEVLGFFARVVSEDWATKNPKSCIRAKN